MQLFADWIFTWSVRALSLKVITEKKVLSTSCHHVAHKSCFSINSPHWWRHMFLTPVMYKIVHLSPLHSISKVVKHCNSGPMNSFNRVIWFIFCHFMDPRPSCYFYLFLFNVLLPLIYYEITVCSFHVNYTDFLNCLGLGVMRDLADLRSNSLNDTFSYHIWKVIASYYINF